jgi:hypothetical protein
VPTLPPGAPNNVSVTPIGLLVFTPTPGVQASIRVWNPGSSVVYIGGPSVTPVTGFPILPGNRPINIQNVGVPIYACSGVSSFAGSGNVVAATVAGVTSLTVATVQPAAGSYIKYGNGNSIEYVQVNGAITGAGPWTVPTTATQLDHGANSTAATATATPGPLSIQAGVG